METLETFLETIGMKPLSLALEMETKWKHFPKWKHLARRHQP
jgi:hypothetical protein